MGSKRVCSFEGCERTVAAFGLCQSHRNQQKRGEPLKPIRARAADGKRPKCKIKGCTRQAKATDPLCPLHREREKSVLKRGLDPETHRGEEPTGLALKDTEICAVEGCEDPYHAQSFCRQHYKSFRKYGDPEAGVRTPSIIRDTGLYLLVEVKGQKESPTCWTKVSLEDRMLVEDRSVNLGSGYARWGEWDSKAKKVRGVTLARRVLGLGRGDPLQADHINGDRLDNRRENLRIVTFAQQMQNKKPWAASGHRNVHSAGVGKGWKVIVKCRKETHYGGTFKEDDMVSAIEAARLLREKLFSHANEERVEGLPLDTHPPTR